MYVLSIIGMMYPVIFIIDKDILNPSLFQDANFLIFFFIGLFLVSMLIFVFTIINSIFKRIKNRSNLTKI